MTAEVFATGDFSGTPVETRTNTSARDGDEVVQVYLRFPKLPGAPRHALRGFTRIHLRAGESQTVRFTLGPGDLSHVDETGTRLVGAGTYGLTIGGGQPGTKAAAETEFVVRGEKRLPR
jgi:beta-glucosidase